MMMKKSCDSSSSDMKPKERHIVSWSKEEDYILREQILIHGTNNWAIIASNFENKTTRQCRRRWFTYLNSDFKRGGWSPEEDTLLCEAQKKFGNRWTEIAKVVSGRTDNAVKNRFSVLCKKKAKHEASTKENNVDDVNSNNKRQNKYQSLETSLHPMKMRRKHIVATTEDYNLEESLVGESRTTDEHLRPPFAVLVQNVDDKIIQSQINEKTEMARDDLCDVKPLLYESLHASSLVDGKNRGEYDSETNQDILPSCNELNNDVGGVCVFPSPNSEFNSPLQVTPLFRSAAQGIPSPQFSESERSFLLKTLGMESAPTKTTTATSQSPPCKKALLHCL